MIETNFETFGLPLYWRLFYYFRSTDEIEELEDEVSYEEYVDLSEEEAELEMDMDVEKDKEKVSVDIFLRLYEIVKEMWKGGILHNDIKII